MKKPKLRADALLVETGLAADPATARALLMSGNVLVTDPEGRESKVDKPGALLSLGSTARLAGDARAFVSRAGDKLEGALDAFGLDVRDRTALDVGMSTGGFTDCLLARGARRVVGVEVGHGQLHPRLRDDPRVTCLEGINARALSAQQLGDAMPAGGFDLIVADVSFISLTLVLPALVPLARPDAPLLALVKPQFELDRSRLDRRGIVADPADHARVQARLRGALAELGCPVLDWSESAVPGGDGNREFFVFARIAARL